MAKDDMILYLALAGGAVVIMLTDNPIKTAIMKLVPTAGGTTDGSATDTGETSGAETKSTTTSKHKRGHGRRHKSHFAYAYPAYEDCGY